MLLVLHCVNPPSVSCTELLSVTCTLYILTALLGILDLSALLTTDCTVTMASL